jgi:transglutaminase-like putative cysteine protease
MPPDADSLAALSYVLDSPQVGGSAAAAAYAVLSFRPRRPILEAVEDLSHRIHRDFRFKPGATAVGTPVEEVLARRAGVCQDFAHLTIASLRSMGLAARYVSGYLETDPPPGQPKLQGADVSHAWASVFVPQIGWVDVDPTNDQTVGDRHITVAWGRDYGDIAPLKGVIFTDGDTTSLTVTVDVRRKPAAGHAGMHSSTQQQVQGVVGTAAAGGAAATQRQQQQQTRSWTAEEH